MNGLRPLDKVSRGILRRRKIVIGICFLGAMGASYRVGTSPDDWGWAWFGAQALFWLGNGIACVSAYMAIRLTISGPTQTEREYIQTFQKHRDQAVVKIRKRAAERLDGLPEA